MTEIEKKALALVNEVVGSGSWTMTNLSHPYNRVLFQALCRAIEQHDAFRQEVSDAVEQHYNAAFIEPVGPLARFIIAKPDPLLDAVGDAMQAHEVYSKYELTDSLRTALAARGGRIVFDQPEEGAA